MRSSVLCAVLCDVLTHVNGLKTLHTLLAPAFAAGLVLDGLEEPAFPDASQAKRAFDWDNFPEIPPVLAVRFRIGEWSARTTPG